jgi:membrane fusion protein (multidrug efflux system)
MIRKSIVATALLLGVAAGGVATWQHFGNHQAQAQSVPPGAGGPSRGAAVEVAKVRTATVRDEIGAVGTLQPDEFVTISPEIEGRIAEILLDEGTRVEAGQPLVKLDDAIYRAELAQAQADLTLARSNYERADTLARQRSGTQRARDEALAALQSAEASFELARTRLDKATIRAPFSGVLGLRSVSPGEFVERGAALVTLQSLDPLKVDFRVPETFLTAVRTGQQVAITVDALGGQAFAGEIYAADPQLDVEGRAIRLRARIPNPGGELRPGLFARVTITAEERESALLVPESAIVPQGGRRFVYRVDGDKVARVEVRLGKRQAGEVEVIEGLRLGDVVVTAGQQRLREGAAVEVVGPPAEV